VGAAFRGRVLGAQPPGTEAHGPSSALNGASPTETFQQLRQAALTSLDFAYDNADESSDFDDSHYDHAEDISTDSSGGPSVVAGRAIYEVSSGSGVPGRL
jgi:hypothetical protein